MNLLMIYFEDLHFDQVFKVKRGDIGHLPDFDFFMLASHIHNNICIQASAYLRSQRAHGEN